VCDRECSDVSSLAVADSFGMHQDGAIPEPFGAPAQ
jgi:hypothetical protein